MASGMVASRIVATIVLATEAMINVALAIITVPVGSDFALYLPLNSCGRHGST